MKLHKVIDNKKYTKWQTEDGGFDLHRHSHWYHNTSQRRGYMLHEFMLYKRDHNGFAADRWRVKSYVEAQAKVKSLLTVAKA